MPGPGQAYTGAIQQQYVDVSPGADGSKRAPATIDGGQTILMANALAPAGTGPTQMVADLTLSAKVFTMVLTENGAPTTHAVVKLEGSLDGNNWYQLIAGTTATGSTPVAATTAAAFLQAKYIRLNITTAMSGGTSPTLTAYVAANN
jgi:hypothetical protein